LAREKRVDNLVEPAHSPFDREYAPFAGNALERMTAAITKAQPRARNQILNRA
jgi:hypothetical protein